jgi:hypothetical protein
VNTTYLLREILQRVIKFKILIIVVALIVAGLFFMVAKKTSPEYTSKATVFPLTNSSDNSLAGGALSSLLGGADATKNFSPEASINIIELALSRNVREAVAAARIPAKGNKTVAELLIEEANNNKSFLSKQINVPADSTSLAVIGGKILMPLISAKINKNGVLELYFTNTDTSLVRLVSLTLIDKISQFYIDLKIEKATADYNFTILKIDSVQKVLNSLDAQAVHMQSTTLFTPSGLLQYDLPKENLSDEKLRVARERDISINNREEALWRLQKVTPIIAVLDKPNPPYDFQKPSSVLYGMIGFIIGFVVMVFIVIAGLLYRFAKNEIKKNVFGDEDKLPRTTTTIAS